MKKKTFTEKTFEDIKNKSNSKESSKKRKNSRLILIIDAIVVLAIIIFFFNKDSSNIYKSSVLKNNRIDTRFSINYQKGDPEYIFTVTIKSNQMKETDFDFNKSIALLTLKSSEIIIHQEKIGYGIDRIKLLPGEVKTFALSVEHKKICDYLKKNRLIKKKLKKTLFSFNRNYLINSELRMNLKEKSILKINFKHEVK